MRFSLDVTSKTSPAPPVRITTLCEAERKKSVEAGEPLMLRCEISDPNAQVTWYKDGVRLHEAAGHAILAEASTRMLMFGSAVLSHAGIYCCKTRDDAVEFHVDVKGDKSCFSLFFCSSVLTDFSITQHIKHEQKHGSYNLNNLLCSLNPVYCWRTFSCVTYTVSNRSVECALFTLHYLIFSK